MRSQPGREQRLQGESRTERSESLEWSVIFIGTVVIAVAAAVALISPFAYSLYLVALIGGVALIALTIGFRQIRQHYETRGWFDQLKDPLTSSSFDPRSSDHAYEKFRDSARSATFRIAFIDNRSEYLAYRLSNKKGPAPNGGGSTSRMQLEFYAVLDSYFEGTQTLPSAPLYFVVGKRIPMEGSADSDIKICELGMDGELTEASTLLVADDQVTVETLSRRGEKWIVQTSDKDLSNSIYSKLQDYESRTWVPLPSARPVETRH